MKYEIAKTRIVDEITYEIKRTLNFYAIVELQY